MENLDKDLTLIMETLPSYARNARAKIKVSGLLVIHRALVLAETEITGELAETTNTTMQENLRRTLQEIGFAMAELKEIR